MLSSANSTKWAQLLIFYFNFQDKTDLLYFWSLIFDINYFIFIVCWCFKIYENFFLFQIIFLQTFSFSAQEFIDYNLQNADNLKCFFYFLAENYFALNSERLNEIYVGFYRTFNSHSVCFLLIKKSQHWIYRQKKNIC